MKLSPVPDTSWAWDQYWRDGRLASCGGEGGVNYQPAIAEGWRRFFETFSDGAHVLDICTGNGAIARLAAEVAKVRGLSVTIDAVDAALINTTEPGPRSDMIRFLSRTPAEALPFPDAAFNVIVGQYAIEYTDIERSLAELARVSQPAVKIRFVMHAANSVVVQGAKHQLIEVEQLMGTGIFEAAEAFVRARGDRLTMTRVYDARGHFQRAFQSFLDASTRAEDSQMYRDVGGAITHALHQQQRVGAGPVLQKIHEASTSVRAHQTRLTSMRRAAFNESGAQALTAQAKRLWAGEFRLEALIRSDGAVLGWVLESSCDH